MMKPHTANLFLQFINERNETDLMRIQYCYPALCSTRHHGSLYCNTRPQYCCHL